MSCWVGQKIRSGVYCVECVGCVGSGERKGDGQWDFLIDTSMMKYEGSRVGRSLKVLCVQFLGGAG